MSKTVINSDLYKPNSYKSKKEAKKKEVKAVVSGTQTREQRVSKKLANTFLSEDVDNVKTYIVMDVLIPAIKDAISEIIHNGADMLIFGVVGGSPASRRRSNNNRGGTYVSYNNMSKTVDKPVGKRSVLDFSEILYQTRKDATDVLENLFEITQQYSSASVADLYSLSDITPNHTDFKYGWEDVSQARVHEVRFQGQRRWIIDGLPRPIRLPED